jgi:hypothetical protein
VAALMPRAHGRGFHLSMLSSHSKIPAMKSIEH